MWWRLALLAAVSVGVLVLLLAPTETVHVSIDLPPAASGAPSPASDAAVSHGVSAAISVIEGVLFVLYLGLVAWIGRWIVRRYGPQR